MSSRSLDISCSLALFSGVATFSSDSSLSFAPVCIFLVSLYKLIVVVVVVVVIIIIIIIINMPPVLASDPGAISAESLVGENWTFIAGRSVILSQ